MNGRINDLTMDPSGFVLLADFVPQIVQEIRYYSTYNFIGDRIDGYEEPVALLTKEAARAPISTSPLHQKSREEPTKENKDLKTTRELYITNAGFIIDYFTRVFYNISSVFVVLFSERNAFDVQLQPLVETADRQAYDKNGYEKSFGYQHEHSCQNGQGRTRRNGYVSKNRNRP